MPSRSGGERSVCFLPYFLSSSPVASVSPRPDGQTARAPPKPQPKGTGCWSAQGANGPCWLGSLVEGCQSKRDGLGRPKALHVRKSRSSRQSSRDTSHGLATARAMTAQAIGAQSLGASRATKGSRVCRRLNAGPGHRCPLPPESHRPHAG